MKRLIGIKLEHIEACLAVHSLRDIPQLNRDAVLWAAKNGQSSSVAAARSGIHYKTVSRAAKKVLETHQIMMQAYLGIEPDPIAMHGNTKEAKAIRKERKTKLLQYNLKK